MADPFASPEDLQILSPDTPIAAAALTLRLVSGSIRSALGWPVSQHTAQWSVMPERRQRRFLLPALNVTAAAVMVGTEPLVADVGYSLDGPLGIVTLASPTTERVMVDYTAGYDPVPEVFEAVALELAMSQLSNPVRARTQWRLGDEWETYNPAVAAEAGSDARLKGYALGQSRS